MVAAKHSLAAEAGLEMIKRSGNAVDAEVATGVRPPLRRDIPGLISQHRPDVVITSNYHPT